MKQDGARDKARPFRSSGEVLDQKLWKVKVVKAVQRNLDFRSRKDRENGYHGYNQLDSGLNVNLL